MKLQFIVATHSPLLITPSNIKNVYKFTNNYHVIKVARPWSAITSGESTLVQMLQIENIAKVFFVDKIIMVEWDTDEYFFKFYFEYLSRNYDKYANIIRNYEVVNINGKWRYYYWRQFLGKFGVDAYFIWDRDNIEDQGIVQSLHHVKDVAKWYYVKNHFAKWSKYWKVVRWLKARNYELYKYITKEIKKLYPTGFLIMQLGDLESYLWLQDKWLEDTIDFCNNQLTNRLNDSFYEKYREELDQMVDAIFPSPY